MITEQNTQPAAADANVKYEYLQVRATVVNATDQDMKLTGSDLSWGKWINSPVDTPRRGSSRFSSQGRDSSPSGTEGWAEWAVGGAVIRVTFSCPLHGSNSQSITCSPSGRFNVNSRGTGGDVNTIEYTIEPGV
jgi:hypothetical protein